MKGSMCMAARNLRRGMGRKSVPAAFISTLRTSFSAKARFISRRLCPGSVTLLSAEAKENLPSAARQPSRPPGAYANMTQPVRSCTVTLSAPLSRDSQACMRSASRTVSGRASFTRRRALFS